MRSFWQWIVLLSLTSCAVFSRNHDANIDPSRDPSSVSPPGVVLESPTEIEKILEETNPVLSESNDEMEKVPLHIPIEINRKVAEWIKFFTVRNRDLTQRYLERGEALRPHIQQLLKENDVPPELYYLAMIESGFVTHAKSRAKAVGVWQFMSGTAKNYGLEVNNTVDERRNWIKATEAAASYLKDLNNVFGSWYLALAAYNAGEHRIVRSIMKGKTRDFWALAEAGLLPKETLNYVPKFLAAHIVGKNMKRFGFEVNVSDESRWGAFETVTVPAGVRLKDIAKASDVSYGELRRWNFDLVRGVTPASKAGTVDIYIPKSASEKLSSASEQIAKLQRQRPIKERAYASRGGDYGIYVVRRGDNLGIISRKLGVTTRTLMKTNGLRRSRIHPGQRLKYHYPQSRSTRVARPNKRILASPSSEGSYGVYVVRKGDSLHTISRQLGVNMRILMKTNQLSDGKIYPGQRLKYILVSEEG